MGHADIFPEPVAASADTGGVRVRADRRRRRPDPRCIHRIRATLGLRSGVWAAMRNRRCRSMRKGRSPSWVAGCGNEEGLTLRGRREDGHMGI